MADVIGQRIAGNLAYIDKAAHLKRLIDAIGPDVIKFNEDFVHSPIDAADSILGATATLVVGGAG
jgi:hypothetical protein